MKQVRKIFLINVCICNLEKRSWWTCFQGKKRDAEVENRLADRVGEGECGTGWESSIDMYHCRVWNRRLVGRSVSHRRLSSLLCDDLEGRDEGRVEGVAIPFSRVSSWHRDRTWVSCIAGRFLMGEPQAKSSGRRGRLKREGHIYTYSGFTLLYSKS